jgi:hypothetical protein
MRLGKVRWVSESKAFIFRYYADVDHDEYLCDDGTIADPDFFSNVHGKEAIPTWSICGVYHRERLHEGDMIFFSPVKQRLKRANIPSYVCTGVLVVGEVLPDKKALLQDPRISKRYQELYSLDLRDHIRKDRLRDRPLTAKKRPFNIVLGDPKKSMWFGRNQLDLLRVLDELRIKDIPRTFQNRNNRNVRSLEHEEASRLYKRLKRDLRPIRDRGHNHLDRERSRCCSACGLNRDPGC